MSSPLDDATKIRDFLDSVDQLTRISRKNTAILRKIVQICHQYLNGEISSGLAISCVIDEVTKNEQPETTTNL